MVILLKLSFSFFNMMGINEYLTMIKIMMTNIITY